MSRNVRPAAKRLATSDPLAALRAMPAVLVTGTGEDGAVSIRALRDALGDLEDVREARLWARGDCTRTAALSGAIGALAARSYRASMDAHERASIPF